MHPPSVSDQPKKIKKAGAWSYRSHSKLGESKEEMGEAMEAAREAAVQVQGLPLQLLYCVPYCAATVLYTGSLLCYTDAAVVSVVCPCLIPFTPLSFTPPWHTGGRGACGGEVARLETIPTCPHMVIIT